jgi:hypothetical protein
MVTPSVDYFALGITMFELWLGEKPFKGIKATKRDYMIAEEQVDLPIDMPDDYATLIKGLIKPQRKDRWGNEQVRKWLKGEALAIDNRDSQKASAVYEPLKFSNTESAVSPKELAALMEKYPDIGKTCLYDGIIKEWLKKAGDLMLYNAIQNITSQYAKDKDAGLYTAILALDPERPFKSRSGKICKTGEDIADAIMAESAYYMEDLKKPTANLYLYLAATESQQGKEAADTFCKYFKEYSPKRALALVYLKLQGDGGITIGTKHYQSPEELKKEKNSAQIALIKKAINEKDSMLLVWLSDINGDNLESTDAFSNLSLPRQVFLLGFLPFLSFKEFSRDSWDILKYFINSCPWRSDLFETYAAQGLPLTGQNHDKWTPIDYAVCNFIDLSRKHDADTIYNLIRLLCKLGADVNEYSGDGRNPLINAYNANDNSLVKLLLEQGADENQYREYKERRDEEERIAEQERQRKKAAREEQERRDKQERKNREDERIRKEAERKREEANEKRKEIARNIIGRILTFVPVIVGIVLYYVTFNIAEDGDVIGDLWVFAVFVIPLILIYFRKLFILSFIIFCFFILFVTIYLCVNELEGVLIITLITGSLSMVASFILALVYPNEDKIKKLTGILAAVIVVAVLGLFSIYRLTGSFFTFQQYNQRAIVAGYSGRRKVVIPETYKGVNITDIGDEAFYKKYLTSVTIPDSVTTIGNFAFSLNKITSVTIPDSVTTIGESAFSRNNLTSVVIPDSVTTIGENAFRYNGLTSVTIGSSVETIGAYAFAGNRLTDVVIPDTVTRIGNGAFTDHRLTDVVIPNSVTYIGEYAFNSSSGYNGKPLGKLTNINIPDSVTYIGVSAFANNPITSVKIGANVELGGTGTGQGVLGEGTGFNTAYTKNNKRAGTYTRANTDSTDWTWTRR